MGLGEEITALAQQFRGRIAERDPRILVVYPVEQYLAYLDAYPRLAHRTHVSPAVSRCCAAIGRAVGEEGLEWYHQLVMLTLIARSLAALPRADLPEEIRDLYGRKFELLVDSIAGGTRPPGYYTYPHFCTELAFCRMIFIPAGVQNVYLYRLPRRLLVSPPWRQAVRAWRMVCFELGGLGPVYDMHTHSFDIRAMQEFDEPGWTKCYLRTAELLRRNPAVKAVICACWWFDPVIETISPRLAFLRTMVLAGGAYLFSLGPCPPGGVCDALVLSPRRQELYDQGAYKPAVYLAVWPRDKLIGWAARQTSAQPAGTGE